MEAKLRIAKRLDAAREERTSVMVPWVHWPGHENTGKGDEFAAPRKQLLLQIRMSHKDEAVSVVLTTKDLGLT